MNGYHKHLYSPGALNQPAVYILCLDIPISNSLKSTAVSLLARSTLVVLSAAQDRNSFAVFTAISSFYFFYSEGLFQVA